MKTQLITLTTGLVFSTLSVVADSVTKHDPWKTSEYSVLAIEGRFAAYIGISPVILDSNLRKKNPKTYLEAIECFGPAFTSRLSSVGTWEWHFDDGMIYRVQPGWSDPLSSSITLKLEKTYLEIISNEKTNPEQTKKQNKSEQATPRKPSD